MARNITSGNDLRGKVRWVTAKHGTVLPGKVCSGEAWDLLLATQVFEAGQGSLWLGRVTLG